MTDLKNNELEKWRDYARQLGFVSPLQAEKDYLQELLLLSLFSIKPINGLIFRGGTALSKLYSSGRFSEDLDFILSDSVDKPMLRRGIESAIRAVDSYYDTEFKLEDYRNMLKYEIKVKGPIYNIKKNDQAKQTIRIDMNTYERACEEAVLLFRSPIYTDIRAYYLRTLSIGEFATDKIKAIVERVDPVARDAYDLWVLLSKYDVKINKDALDMKLAQAGKAKFDRKAFERKLLLIGKLWDKEMSQLTSIAIKYPEVKKAIVASLPK